MSAKFVEIINYAVFITFAYINIFGDMGKQGYLNILKILAKVCRPSKKGECHMCR